MRRQAAAPHRIVGADNQQLGRMARDTPPAPAARQRSATSAHPCGACPGPCGEATVTSVSPRRVRRLPRWPASIQPVGRSNRRETLSMRNLFLPMRGQAVSTLFQPSGSSNCKARNQLGAVLLIEFGRRHQIVAAHQRPGRGHAGVEAAVLAPVADASRGRSGWPCPLAGRQTPRAGLPGVSCHWPSALKSL